MKHFYIVALAAALCVLCAPTAMAHSARTAGIWRPVSVTEYTCSFWTEGEDINWTELSSTTFTYDIRGNITKENKTLSYGGSSVSEYTYDEICRLSTSQNTELNDDGSIQSADRKEYGWDTVVPEFRTSLWAFEYNDGNWDKTSESETKDITRDNSGNVTEVISSAFNGYTGELIPNKQLSWTYGQDSKANALEIYDLNSDIGPHELAGTIENITWANTDGQLLYGDLEEYLEGTNRISSAKFTEYENTSHFVAEYDINRPGDYIATVTTEGSPIKSTISKTYTDDYGSYIKTTRLNSEYTDENGNQCNVLVLQDRIIKVFDESGRIADETNERYDDFFSSGKLSGTKTEYKYDDSGNLAESITYSFDTYGLPDAAEIQLTPQSRFVYGTYSDVSTSVNTIKVSDTYPATIFNAQGIAVKNVNSESELNELPAGFYIINGRKYLRR